MSARDFLDLVRRKPFVPFRVITSDGTIYEINHPDLVMAGLSSVIIGYPSEQEPHAYSRYDIVSLRHVVRLEPREEPAET
ncbi:MAG TPA: hypothetical protein VN688_12770 [Gemmataceae bacterium]|nr:hypothetical protein [Gemmataceae bacterium]